MSVSRTSSASPPVQGTIDVTFNGVTKSGNIKICVGTMSFSRNSFVSPPVQGNIDVTFNGVTKSGNISVKSDFF